MLNIRQEYEPLRLSRYSGINQNTRYTERDLLDAYNAWANLSARDRVNQWTVYCDVRDHVPIGTNATIEAKRKQRDAVIVQ